MPQYPNRQFLDFEKPIKDLYEQIDRRKSWRPKIQRLIMNQHSSNWSNQYSKNDTSITEHLTPWQRVQLSRHPDRPYTLKYIEKMFTNFIELHGDRNVKDDKAMVGGFAELDGQTSNGYRTAERY